MSVNNFKKETIKIFKALSDPTRYKLIKMLAQNKELSCEAINNAFKLSRSAMSNHFRIIENAGLLKIKKNGVYHFFSLNKKYLEKFIPDFSKIHK